MARYIDPKTDFGFKRLFGQEDSKDILKQFLFDVLALPYPIQELTYIPPEQLPATADERMGVYDVYCTDVVGQRFIVEMQRGWQTFIRDRVLYYSTFPIIHQARRGAQWHFELVPVYCVVILNFTLDTSEQYLRRIPLLDVQTKQVFFDKLAYVYIELPNFKLEPHELTTEADKWIYLLKHMPELQNIPAELAHESFTRAFEIAEEAALSPRDRYLYEASLKSARDAYAELVSARELGLAEGRAEGREEGRLEERRQLVRAMFERGLDYKAIGELTSLSEAEIAHLLHPSANS